MIFEKPTANAKYAPDKVKLLRFLWNIVIMKIVGVG